MDLETHEVDMPYAQRPDSLKKLRACRTCKLIKTYDQFFTNFCENCPTKVPDGTTAGKRDDFVIAETTEDFEGMVSMMQPENSWVARWLRMQVRGADDHLRFVKPGLYAISLPGEEAAAAATNRDTYVDEEDRYEDEDEDDGEPLDSTRQRLLDDMLGQRKVDKDDPSSREDAIESAAIAPDDDSD